MLGMLGQFDGVAAKAIILPLWPEHVTSALSVAAAFRSPRLKTYLCSHLVVFYSARAVTLHRFGRYNRSRYLLTDSVELLG